MTVSTINNVSADLKRIQENQNKQADTQVSPKGAPQTATLPVDSVADSALREVLGHEAAQQATATQNIEASQSTLTDDDIDALGGTAQEKVLAQAKEALSAQTSKLPPNVLALLVE